MLAGRLTWSGWLRWMGAQQLMPSKSVASRPGLPVSLAALEVEPRNLSSVFRVAEWMHRRASSESPRDR